MTKGTINEKTHKFKLPSGVDCEVVEMKGKHQMLLTKQSSKSMVENLNDMLLDLVVSLGGEPVTRDIIESLLDCDRKKILVEVRQFSLDFEKTFELTYEFMDSNNKTVRKDLVLDVSGGFEVKPLMIYDSKKNTYKEAQYKSYSEIERTVYLTLPKSGQKVSFKLLDGKLSNALSKIPKSKYSSNTILEARVAKYYEADSKGDERAFLLDPNKLGLRDIEFLRKVIKNVEGSVDTMVSFENPDTNNMLEPTVSLDLMTHTAFFFPSEST